MNEETTQNLTDGRSFEERVFARFDAMDASLRGLNSSVQDLNGQVQDLNGQVRALDARLQTLEARAYDTKPIWEQALREIMETRRDLSRRLDRIEGVVHETRADLRDAEDRIERLEAKPAQ